ncbi:MAG: LytTR family DNA-binding domain-containing protein [Bacteroidota bacterium]
MSIKPMNCIIIEDSEDSRILIEEFVKKTRMLNLVGSFSSAIEAIRASNPEEKVDMVLLDIELPEMSGMEYIRALTDKPAVIILSGQAKYALEAYENDVSDYIVKPVSYTRFYKAVSRAYTQWRREQNIQKIQNDIFIRKGSSLVRLSYEDILWIEALENYVLVYTTQEILTVHFTLKAIIRKLPPDQFLQVHRSHIVNINRINTINRNSLLIWNGQTNREIPIGKSYREQLLANINLMSR